jgi:dipeptidyl aminopeptidase/acylaminoacyl peptidase
MPAKITASFGLWPSPIKPRDLTRGARRFGHIQGDGPFVYWTEGRPEEKGRQVIVRMRPGIDRTPQDVLPAPFSARSKVHEYGGAEFMVRDDTVYFINADDQDVWSVVPGTRPERITNAPGNRFADLALDPPNNRLIAVAERHDARGGHTEPQNLLVGIGLSGATRGMVSDLVTGRDFYAFPRLSPDGTRLAFLGWDLPDMPWDQSALYVAPVRQDGSIGRPQRIAGGDGAAAMQPTWLDNEHLLFLSDETGFGNAMVWDGARSRALTRLKTELGQPMWALGSRTFVATAPDSLVACSEIEDKPALVTVTDLAARRPKLEMRPIAGTSIGSLSPYDQGIAAIVGRPKAPAALVALSGRRKGPAILRTASDLDLDPTTISVGRTLSFRGGDRKTTFAQYYPPVSGTHRGPRGALPPALVLAHGGPTSQAGRGLSLRVQSFTSRGFAVLDVDYSGSTGYGRAYRERLDGQWGIADVADCAAGARFLASEGLADGERIAIAGGSAGGYTVLMALATTKVFAAGSSHYGISDLSLLMQSTHKFEAGYLHRLLRTTPRSWKTVCKARSPITLIAGMTAPLVLFQGLDDKVVPPDQSRIIHERLKQRGVLTELHEFAGEGHGFRQASTIVKVAEAEMAFLRSALRLG